MRLTILPWLVWALFIVTVVWATKAYSDPRLQAVDDGVRVILYDDKCELEDQITNLPYKAVWEEKGKTYRGCWGPRPDMRVMVAYFEDKTIGVIPMGALTRVSGA